MIQYSYTYKFNIRLIYKNMQQILKINVIVCTSCATGIEIMSDLEEKVKE